MPSPPPATTSSSPHPTANPAQNRTSAPSQSTSTRAPSPPPGAHPAQPPPPPGPSGKKRRRRVKEKSERLNRKNWADGVRKDMILLKYVPLYVDALATSWEAAQEVIRQACAEYHAKIPYWLDDNDEPDLPLPDYDPKNPPVLPPLSDEEESLRSQILTVRNQAIHRWIHWRAKKLPGYRQRHRVNLDNPYDRMMVELTGLSARGPKKALQPIQQYAVEHPELTAAAAQAWEDEKASGGGSVFFNDQFLTQRPVNWIMKELKKTWDPLPADEKKAYGERARAIAKAEKEKWDNAFKETPPRNAQSIQKCWDYLQSFLTPTLHGLATHMDATVLILVGARNPSANGNPTAKHFLIGKNKQGLPFSLYDQSRFEQDVVGMFCDYIETMWSPAECAAVALRDDPMAEEDYGPLGRTRFAEHEVSDDEDSDSDVDDDEPERGKRGQNKRPRRNNTHGAATAGRGKGKATSTPSSGDPPPAVFDTNRPHQTFDERNAPPTEKGHARYAWELEKFTRSVQDMFSQGVIPEQKCEQLLQEWKGRHYVDGLSGVFYELVATPGSSSGPHTASSIPDMHESRPPTRSPSPPMRAFDTTNAQQTFTDDNPPPVESGTARFAWELEKYDRSIVRLSWKGGADKRTYEQLMQAWHASHYVDAATGFYVERTGPLDARPPPSPAAVPPQLPASSVPPIPSPSPTSHQPESTSLSVPPLLGVSSPPAASPASTVTQLTPRSPANQSPAPPPRAPELHLSASPPAPSTRPFASPLASSGAPTPPPPTTFPPATLPPTAPPSPASRPSAPPPPIPTQLASSQAPPTRDASSPPGAVSLSTPSSALDNPRATWFVDAWGYIAQEFGPSWAELLSRFARWEEVNGYANSRKSLPTLNTRPKDLQTWIGNARWSRQSGEPNPKDRAFARRLLRGWWAWYKRLVPSWRKEMEGGMLEPLAADVAQFDMGKLDCCGLNGVYNLIVLLKWVKQGADNPVLDDSIIHPELDHEWELAVRDLSGMLDRMRVVKLARKT